MYICIYLFFPGQCLTPHGSVPHRATIKDVAIVVGVGHLPHLQWIMAQVGVTEQWIVTGSGQISNSRRLSGHSHLPRPPSSHSVAVVEGEGVMSGQHKILNREDNFEFGSYNFTFITRTIP